MTKTWPPVLRRLGEEVGYEIKPAEPALGYELFTIDLASWKLKLTNATPIIWVKASDLESVPVQHVLQSLADVRRERNWGRQVVLVLLDGPSQPLLAYTSSPLYSLVIIGRAEQETLLHSRRPPELADLSLRTRCEVGES